MSFVGLFSNARPEIAGFFFDALIEESDTLATTVTEFPVETGDVGHDHVAKRPLSLTMRVGVSDNPFRVARSIAANSDLPLAGAASNLTGAAIGAGLGQLGGAGAAGAGLVAGAAGAGFAAGQDETRSENVLESVRSIQRRADPVEVVGAKARYPRMVITNTRRETTKENEQALELVIEMQELLTVSSPFEDKSTPAPNDPAATQAQPGVDLGQKVAQ